jgi:argininosuccinate lyase
VNVLSLLGLHLSRWAEEMILFSSQEYRFVILPDAYSTGSSAMPQKKNGDLLELTRGKAARLIGDAVSLMVTLKGLPLAYNKDLQETQQPVFEAAETLLTLAPLVTGWMQAVEFNFDGMQEAAGTGFMNAFAAATYLTHRGVPFRMAHEQIGKAVALCLEKGCELQDLSLEELRGLNAAFDQDFYGSLSLQAVLGIHDVAGATAPAQVKLAIAEAKRELESMKEETHAHA